MKILLLAKGDFGLAVAEILRANNTPVSWCIVDSNEDEGNAAQIQRVLGIDTDAVVQWDLLAESDQLEAIRASSPDLGLSAWWPHILKTPLLTIPRLGILNFHPSLLPFGRGKDPNFWALRDEEDFGATIHFMDEDIDTGDIAFQAPIEVTWEDDAASLYKKARRTLLQMFETNLPRILAGDIPRCPQPPGTRAKKRSELEAASEVILDKTYTARQVLNLLRARTFPPHPGAWFVEDGRRFEVRVEITQTRGELDDDRGRQGN